MLMADADHPGTGHRQRLRQRLLDGGPDALADHELIECLLGFAIPRRDTKDLAKDLIREYGGFAALLAADPQSLGRRLGPSTVAALKLVQAAAARTLKSDLRERDLISSWQALIDYLRLEMGHLAVEQVRVLFLDTKNRLIRDEKMWEGSVDESAVYVREILRRALELHASAIIVVHNHPSGDPSPSQQDIRLTRELAEAARPLRIALHDHVIVGAHGEVSLRAQGAF